MQSMVAERLSLAVAARALVAQLDRALASGARGYRFDPCRGYSVWASFRTSSFFRGLREGVMALDAR